MENNANEAHIFWKSQDQQTEVWMKQVSGKNTGRKERTVPVGISSVSRNDKNKICV